MASNYFFRGLTTVNRNKPPYSAVNFELVKVDLLNHFNTRLGERVMLPNFGSRIYDLLMDPLDDQTREEIRNDVIRIIDADPRVILNDMQLTENEHGIILELQLMYAPTGDVEEINVQFETEVVS